VQRAVDNGCTAIFSMHINASGTGTAKGAVILTPNASSYHKEFYQMGIDLAGLVLPRIKTATGIGIWKGFNNIGTWPRDYPTYDPADHPFYPGGGVWDYYGIVRYARLNGMFGVIIEHGFIDNASDASKMRSADSRKKLGEADADAIRAFYQ
jgi:N-acetylmuramoyl-L-alanine amidase